MEKIYDNLLRVFMIIRGNYYRLIGKNELLFYKRYTACKRCPFNSKNKKDLTFFEKLWTITGEYCTVCSCPLKSKLIEPLSECPELYWGQENKNKKTK